MPTLTALRVATLNELGDGVHAFVKRDCAACTLVGPVLGSLVRAAAVRTVHSQDDPTFPEDVATVGLVGDDTSLRRSFSLGIETVPTLIRIENGIEVAHRRMEHRRVVLVPRARPHQRVCGVAALATRLRFQEPRHWHSGEARHCLRSDVGKVTTRRDSDGRGRARGDVCAWVVRWPPPHSADRRASTAHACRHVASP